MEEGDRQAEPKREDDKRTRIRSNGATIPGRNKPEEVGTKIFIQSRSFLFCFVPIQ